MDPTSPRPSLHSVALHPMPNPLFFTSTYALILQFDPYGQTLSGKSVERCTGAEVCLYGWIVESGPSTVNSLGQALVFLDVCKVLNKL